MFGWLPARHPFCFVHLEVQPRPYMRAFGGQMNVGMSKVPDSTRARQITVRADQAAGTILEEHLYPLPINPVPGSLNNQHVSHTKLTGRLTFKLDFSCQSRERTLDRLLGQSGSSPDSATYAFVLRLCGNATALSDGKRLHHLMIETGHEKDQLLGILLIQMYGKCGAVVDARACFVHVHERNVLLWNSMIGAYARNKLCNEAFQLFVHMQVEGVMPDKITYISFLSACTFLRAGKYMHTFLHSSAFDTDVVVGTTLINMYSKCGSLDEAHRLFDNMSSQSVVIWNSAIAAYAHHRNAKDALQLFAQMLQEGITPDKVTFVSVLSACAYMGGIYNGKYMHSCIMQSGLESNVIVDTALVNMYVKCASLDDAWGIFDKMHERNVYSWNAMMAGYAQHGRAREAIQLFHQMLQEGVIPDKVSFVSILLAHASQAVLMEGRQMHVQIFHSGFESDIVVLTALVNMYGKCGSVQTARQIFDNIWNPNIVSWNAMIATYARYGYAKDAYQLFNGMEAGGVVPDKITFISLLDACALQVSLVDCKVIHCHILQSGFESDVVVATALVDMYGKRGCVKEAQNVFDNFSNPNVVTWNAMITAYVQHENGVKALELFNQMQIEGVIPDQVTFVNILSAFSGETALFEGKWMHARIDHNRFQLDVVVANALINMYGKCESYKDAQLMFDKIPERTVVSWNAVISACAQHGQVEEAMRYFNQMQWENVFPDTVTFSCIVDAYTGMASLSDGKRMHSRILGTSLELDIIVIIALVNMYGRCSSMQDAQRVFVEMSLQDVVAWNAIIALFAQQGWNDYALQIFEQMQVEGVFPDSVTFSSILTVCATQAALRKGKRLHVRIIHSGFESDVFVANAIINMYGKCGSLKHAESIFNSMSERNGVSWTAMITVYAQHGCGRDALQLFGKMQQEGVVPDSVTFISILSACSRDGLVGEGYHLLVSMNECCDVTLTAEHYGCVIDMLGRAGRLEEAEGLVRNMPVQSSSVLWMILLGSCKERADVERGERAAKEVLELSPEKAAPYVVLSNIYAAAVGGKNAEIEHMVQIQSDQNAMQACHMSSRQT